MSVTEKSKVLQLLIEAYLIFKVIEFGKRIDAQTTSRGIQLIPI